MIFTERQQKLVLLALSYLQFNLDDVEEVFSPDDRNMIESRGKRMKMPTEAEIEELINDLG